MKQVALPVAKTDHFKPRRTPRCCSSCRFFSFSNILQSPQSSTGDLTPLDFHFLIPAHREHRMSATGTLPGLTPTASYWPPTRVP